MLKKHVTLYRCFVVCVIATLIAFKLFLRQTDIDSTKSVTTESEKHIFLTLTSISLKPTATAVPPSTSGCPSLALSIPLPAYIDYVFPKYSINISEYNSLRENHFVSEGVTVVIWADFVDSSIYASNDSSYRQTKMKEITKLHLNEVLISTPSYIGDGLQPEGPFYVHWAPNLSAGLYTATVEIETDRDEVLTYSWQFCITEE